MMTMMFTKVGLLLALIAAGLCLAHQTAAEATSDVQQQQQQQPAHLASATSNHRLQPKMLTFERFKDRFHKAYGNFLEEASRKMLYLGRVFLTFMSSISFKHNKASSFMAINQMSDWTDKEYQSILINEDQLRKQQLAARQPGEPEQPLELVDLPERDNATNNKVRGYYYEEDGQLAWIDMDKAKETHPQQRKKRDIFGGPKERLTFHDYRSWKPKWAKANVASCLQPIRNQGFCGSCYIFSMVALYEWMYCALTGQSIGFSEQFVLDCGAQVGLGGCRGGYNTKVAQFVDEFGVELRANYPYEAMAKQCPSGTREELGLGRFKRPDLVRVLPEDFDELLGRGPFVVNMFVPYFFMLYGGGVDGGRVCNKWAGHSMLLVGDGRENGRDFWLFRNSHSKSWGEQGYYRLSKQSKCLFNYGSVPMDYFRSPKLVNLYEFHENPRYNASLIEQLRAQRTSGRNIFSRLYQKYLDT